MDLREYKGALRLKYRGIRRNMPPSVKAELDKSIFDRLTAHQLYRDCETLLTFVSTDIEVDTRMLITKALSDGKTVAVPRCVDGTREMEFFRLSSFSDLEPGAFGVLEPNPDRCEKLTHFSDFLCIVPGLAFDEKGYRLGYGKGYYDRFLNAHKQLIKIGVCYRSCTLKKLIHGRFDVAVEYLITERYTKNLSADNSKL